MLTKDRGKISQDNFQRQQMLDYARRLLPEEEKDCAEDIVQEAFVRLSQHADWSQIGNINNYILKVVQNVCHDRSRSRSESRNSADRRAQSNLKDNLDWHRGRDPNFPYEARVNGDKLVVRLNDFPDATLYTLLVNDEEAADFDDWPDHWTREMNPNQP